MDKLRATDKFNLDARNLADAWKKWKEELNLNTQYTSARVLNINFKSERAGTPKISITEIRYNTKFLILLQGFLIIIFHMLYAMTIYSTS
jgi:hypothetical protein